MPATIDTDALAKLLPERFQVRRTLGTGGFGAVYEVYDREFSSLVALKVLTHLSAQTLLSFKREFRGLAGIVHDNLVTLYDFMHANDLWFFTMELLDGADFLRAVRTSPSTRAAGDMEPCAEDVTLDGHLPTLDASELLSSRLLSSKLVEDEPESFDEERLRDGMRQLVEGIEKLHRSGIVHRDIKPSNVWVTEEGRVVVLDFGLIVEATPSASVSHLQSQDEGRPVSFVGTPHYMAPEQALGQEIGPATDYYSVGVILYESLTGRRPIDGASALQVLLRKQSAAPLHVLDLNPDAPIDLAELCMRLLERVPERRPGYDEIVASLERVRVAPPRAPMRAVFPEVFVGRGPQIVQIHEAIERASAASRVCFVNVRGPSGIGKSALLDRVVSQLEMDSGNLVLRGRCFENESVPFKAVDQLVDALGEVLACFSPERRAGFCPRALAALARLFPSLERLDTLEVVSDIASVADSLEQRRIGFDGFRRLLGELGESHELFLVLDDVQWGDEDSAALVEYLLQPPNAPRVTFITSWREEARTTSPFLMSLLGALDRWDAELERVEIALGALDEGDSGRMLELLLDGSGYADTDMPSGVLDEASGNPLFLGELARYLRDNGGVMEARSLDDILFGRISELPELALELLRYISVSGQPIDQLSLGALVDANGGERAGVELLRAESLVRTMSSSERLLLTYHDRIRESVVARMPRAQLCQTHLNLARVFSETSTGEPEVIARHFISGGDVESARPLLLQAAQIAYDSLAFERAVRLWRELLERYEFERAERSSLLTRLGEVLGYLGHAMEAAQAYQRAELLEDASNAVELRRLAAEQMLRAGHYEQGSELMGSLLERVGLNIPGNNALLLAGVAALRARVVLKMMNAGRSVEFTPMARQRAEISWSAAQHLSVTDLKLGAYFGAIHLLDALSHHDPDHLSLSLSLEAVYQAGSPRGRARAAEYLERATEHALRASDRPYCEGFVCFGRGMTAHLSGRWEAALGHFQDAEHILETECRGVVWELAGARFYQFMCQDFMGEFKPWHERLPHLLEEAERREDSLYAQNWRIWSFRRFLARDRPDRALEEIDRACELKRSDRFLIQDFWVMYARVNVLLYAARPVEALAVYEESRVGLRSSLLLQLELIEGLVEDAALRAALGVLATRPEHPKVARKARMIARRATDKLGKYSNPTMKLMALIGLSQLAWLDAQPGAASELAAQALALASRCQVMAHSRSLELWLEHLGGAAKRSAADSARAWFAQQGVLEPRAYARTYIPCLG